MVFAVYIDLLTLLLHYIIILLCCSTFIYLCYLLVLLSILIYTYFCRCAAATTEFPRLGSIKVYLVLSYVHHDILE